MPSLIMARGILGHFARNADLPTVFHPISPPPIQSSISFSLWVILVAGAGGRGVQGGAGRCSIPQEVGRGGRGAGDNYVYRGGAMGA